MSGLPFPGDYEPFSDIAHPEVVEIDGDGERNAELDVGDEPHLPYPWCRDPEGCAGKGCCPRDPNCGE